MPQLVGSFPSVLLGRLFLLTPLKVRFLSGSFGRLGLYSGSFVRLEL